MLCMLHLSLSNAMMLTHGVVNRDQPRIKLNRLDSCHQEPIQLFNQDLPDVLSKHLIGASTLTFVHFTFFTQSGHRKPRRNKTIALERINKYFIPIIHLPFSAEQENNK